MTFYVAATDFTFSTTQGFKPVPFATAGDCYSSTKRCPQVNVQLCFCEVISVMVINIRLYS